MVKDNPDISDDAIADKLDIGTNKARDYKRELIRRKKYDLGIPMNPFYVHYSASFIYQFTIFKKNRPLTSFPRMRESRKR